MSLGPHVWTRTFFVGGLIYRILFGILCGSSLSAAAQSPAPQTINNENGAAAGPGINDSPAERHSLGYINGTVLDKAGAVAVGAHLRLTSEGQTEPQKVLSGSNGQFSFANRPPALFSSQSPPTVSSPKRCRGRCALMSLTSCP